MKKIKKHIILILILILLNMSAIGIYFLIKKVQFEVKTTTISNNIEEKENLSDLEKYIVNSYIDSDKYNKVKNIPPHILPSGEKYITYEDLDSYFDDDYTKIYYTHVIANENNYSVKATKKKYDIYKNDKSVINIQTNTDWNNAQIVIHDENIKNSKTRNYEVFAITSKNEEQVIKDSNILKNICNSLNENKKDIRELTSYTNAYCILWNKNKKEYIRSGVDSDSGKYQVDTLIVKDGKIIDNNIKFQELTEVEIIPTDTETIKIENGYFVTNVSNENFEQDNGYWNRNIICTRSNTVIQNINHKLSNDSVSYGPYFGFIKIVRCSNIYLKDCNLSAHTYIKKSNYDLTITLVNNIELNNVNTLNPRANQWGVTGNNYLKNAKFINCKLNRIDCHCGGNNIKILNCNIGDKGITLSGGGVLEIENSEVNSNLGMIYLRPDFGSRWDGLIKIINSKTHNSNIINIGAVENHYYGYELKLPNVWIDGLEIIDEKSNGNYLFNYDKKLEINKIFNISKEINIKNVKNQNKYIRPFLSTEILRNIQYFNYDYLENKLNNINNLNNKLIINKTEIPNIFDNSKLNELELTKIKESVDDEFIILSSLLKEKNNNFKDKFILFEKIINEFKDIYVYYYISDFYVRDDNTNELINIVIDKYNKNNDIELKKEEITINYLKDIYEKNINIDKKEEKNYNNIIIENLINTIYESLENKIKETAQQEAQKIGIAYNIDQSTLTNKDVIAQIKLPNSKSSIESNPNNEKYTFTENGTKNITINIRGYEYTYTIKVNNIDKTVPKITAQNGQSLKINATDDNLKEIKIEKDGKEIAVNNGQTITTPGIYKITATDKAGNSTNKTAIVYGTYINEQNSEVNYVTIKSKTKVSDVKQDGDYTVKDNNSIIAGVKRAPSRGNTNAEKDSNSYIATGDILQDNNNTYIVITLGDLSSNGDVGAADLIKLRKSLVGLTKLTKLQELAADTNQNGSVNVSDLLKERKIMVGAE